MALNERQFDLQNAESEERVAREREERRAQVSKRMKMIDLMTAMMNRLGKGSRFFNMKHRRDPTYRISQTSTGSHTQSKARHPPSTGTYFQLLLMDSKRDGAVQ